MVEVSQIPQQRSMSNTQRISLNIINAQNLSQQPPTPYTPQPIQKLKLYPTPFKKLTTNNPNQPKLVH